MDEETFRRLQQENWGEIGKSLLAVAVNWARKYPSLRRGEPGQLALGKTCDDIVQDLILKTLAGERKWDPARGDLIPWLKESIKSEVDNLANRKGSTNELLLDQHDDKDFESSLESQVFENPFGSNPIPNVESVLVQREKEEEIKQEVANIYRLVERDEPLELLVLAMDCLLSESKSLRRPPRRKLAEELSVSETEIDNRMKRLRRRLLKVKGEG